MQPTILERYSECPERVGNRHSNQTTVHCPSGLPCRQARIISRNPPQESPHFDRHITAAWLAVTLWGAPCCSSRGASLPRAIRSTCPDRRRRAATGAAFYSTALKS